MCLIIIILHDVCRSAQKRIHIYIHTPSDTIHYKVTPRIRRTKISLFQLCSRFDQLRRIYKSIVTSYCPTFNQISNFQTSSYAIDIGAKVFIVLSVPGVHITAANHNF